MTIRERRFASESAKTLSLAFVDSSASNFPSRSLGPIVSTTRSHFGFEARLDIASGVERAAGATLIAPTTLFRFPIWRAYLMPGVNAPASRRKYRRKNRSRAQFPPLAAATNAVSQTDKLQFALSPRAPLRGGDFARRRTRRGNFAHGFAARSNVEVARVLEQSSRR